ncbi:MAG: 1-acyl-sn-glycerol-3-phosphate acyltransferase [Candidatus Yonathbacteria bacterium]|nr:1-acyl-sn-glycerol-3-phosphate acyltransferase [Candidatus Yonathbacteria bacterium]
MTEGLSTFREWTVSLWWTFAPWFLQNLIWIPTRIILHLFFHIRIEGKEYVRHLSGPVIFAVNHTSFWDPIFVAGALPWFSRRYPVLYVARERSYYYRYGKYFPMFLFKIWGAHPAHGGLRDYAASLSAHEDFLKKGMTLCMFPEGKVARTTTEIQPFKGGIGYLMYETKATVVPVALTGTYGMSFSKIIRGNYKVVVSFGMPISLNDIPSQITQDDESVAPVKIYKEIARIIWERTYTIFEKNKKEI